MHCAHAFYYNTSRMKQLLYIGGAVVVLLVLLFVFAQLGGAPPTDESALEHTGTTSNTFSLDEIAQEEDSEDAVQSADMNDVGTTSRVVLQTNRGDITLELFTETMPITTGNFLKLAREDFYDGIKFHRVIEGFMIQAGDPLTRDDSAQARWGSGGPGYTIEDEFVEGLSNLRGTIAMANTGRPDSGGSQFFINVADNTNLDFNKQPLQSKHPVFGRVVEGMDVVDEIAQSETGPRDVPQEPVIIEDIVIE